MFCFPSVLQTDPVMPRIPVIAQDLAPEPLASKPSRYRGKAPKRAKPYIRLGASNVEI